MLQPRRAREGVIATFARFAVEYAGVERRRTKAYFKRAFQLRANYPCAILVPCLLLIRALPTRRERTDQPDARIDSDHNWKTNVDRCEPYLKPQLQIGKLKAPD